MAEPLTPEELRRAVSTFGTQPSDPFGMLQQLMWLAGSDDIEDERLARELVVRFLEHRAQLNGHRPMLDALVRDLGLFPYLNPQDLSAADQLAFEAHRPLNMDDSDIVFHEVQAHVYRELLSGNNVILSAPTSFGKSLVIDALIASMRYRNVVIVVPTIALIDETRRRLSRYRDRYKVITHVSQALAERNVFVLTQERVIDHADLPRADLFVIDEFYKLDAKADPDRGHLLNQAFYKLWKGGGQFYFLGPNIDSIPTDLPGTFRFNFVKTDYSTVVVDVERVSQPSGDKDALIELCGRLDEPTLIYCSSPARTRDVARWLVEAGIGQPSSNVNAAADWIGAEYHPSWLVGIALRSGIGIHHGRVPRALAQYMVRAFNSGDVRFLVCTSTLIEGVNTRAKNVVIFDNRVARQNLDYFTFNNIRGRSGRMFEHFVGRVFLFHDPPPVSATDIDLPVLTQDGAPDSLLVQVDDEDLSDGSREQLEPLAEQNDLTLDTVRENSGLDPQRQIDLARRLRARASQLNPLLAWNGYPTYDQLSATCNLIWEFLVTAGIRGAGVRSAAQLAFKVSRLARVPGVKGQIEAELENERGPGGDEAVEDALAFIRQWAGHHFPRLLMAMERIQDEVFRSLGLPAGSYRFYAAQVENLFLPSPLIALDEYGIPIPTAVKLSPLLEPNGDLDELLTRLRSLDAAQLPITEFERGLVRDTQATI